jgi:hypothetical protein
MAHRRKKIIVKCGKCNNLTLFTYKIIPIKLFEKDKLVFIVNGKIRTENFQRNYNSYNQMIADLERFGCEECNKGYGHEKTNGVIICSNECNKCSIKFNCFTQKIMKKGIEKWIKNGK